MLSCWYGLLCDRSPTLAFCCRKQLGNLSSCGHFYLIHCSLLCFSIKQIILMSQCMWQHSGCQILIQMHDAPSKQASSCLS